MNIGSQIKKYREQLKISQEELADKVFVSRQTISNWENNKNYPDIKSLSLLSYIFNVSIDDFMIVLILSVVPLFMWLERYALIPFGIFYAITMLWALKVEKLKKDNNIQTYKEIVAFVEGKELSTINKQVEIGKRPYQKILLAIGSAIITTIVCFIVGLLINIFLN